MKRFSIIVIAVFIAMSMFAQSPQKMSYQAIVRDASGHLVQNSNVGIRINILQGSASGTAVYTETHVAATNINGLVSVEIGGGTTTNNFSDINWAAGPYFLKTETDPKGSTNYSITGVSQLLSVPFAFYTQIAGNGFSGDYNDLINKPITDGSETKIQAGQNMEVTGTGTNYSPYVVKSTIDGSETKIQAGQNITLTGNGTTASPYVIKSTNNCPTGKITITTYQMWSVPAEVSKIKVELWGAAGGGGGAGAYSYSYYLNAGGNGGSGGYAQQELNVMENQQFTVVIGAGGAAGTNAEYIYPYYYGDTDGGNGGDTWFGSSGIKAAGGTGGKRGSYSYNTVHGLQGTANTGSITGYSEDPQSTFLNVFQGLARSYINDRVLTSKPGKGGLISPYSTNITPTAGEGGCAIITLFE
jgi:hypothetical protein